MEIPDIKINKTEYSVIIEKDHLRYEVYFDKPDYSVFVGQPGEGSMLSVSPNLECFEFHPRW